MLSTLPNFIIHPLQLGTSSLVQFYTGMYNRERITGNGLVIGSSLLWASSRISGRVALTLIFMGSNILANTNMKEAQERYEYLLNNFLELKSLRHIFEEVIKELKNQIHELEQTNVKLAADIQRQEQSTSKLESVQQDLQKETLCLGKEIERQKNLTDRLEKITGSLEKTAASNHERFLSIENLFEQLQQVTATSQKSLDEFQMVFPLIHSMEKRIQHLQDTMTKSHAHLERMLKEICDHIQSGQLQKVSKTPAAGAALRGMDLFSTIRGLGLL